LRELLRLESVSGHQAERPEKPRLLTVEEDLEVHEPLPGDRFSLWGVRGQTTRPVVHHRVMNARGPLGVYTVDKVLSLLGATRARLSGRS
jgi:hypothetical protein